METKKFLANCKQQNKKLIEERKKLQSVTAKLDELRSIEEYEQSLNEECRVILLEKTVARNEAEIQLLKTREKIRQYDSDIEKFEQERVEYEELAIQEKELWEQQVSTLYAPEKLKMEVYIECLQDVIRTKQRQVQVREERLTSMKDKLSSLQQDGEQYEHQVVTVQDELTTLERTIPNGRDEEMTELSNLFEKTFQEVCGLLVRFYLCSCSSNRRG